MGKTTSCVLGNMVLQCDIEAAKISLNTEQTQCAIYVQTAAELWEMNCRTALWH
jgi:hypothetical protein